MPSWIIHVGSCFPLAILTHLFSFFFFPFNFFSLLNSTLNSFLLGRSYISEGSVACPKSWVFFSRLQWQASENKSWKSCFPSLLHIPPRTLPEQCKAETTGDKSAGKKICLTSLTQIWETFVGDGTQWKIQAWKSGDLWLSAPVWPTFLRQLFVCLSTNYLYLYYTQP